MLFYGLGGEELDELGSPDIREKASTTTGSRGTRMCARMHAHTHGRPRRVHEFAPRAALGICGRAAVHAGPTQGLANDGTPGHTPAPQRRRLSVQGPSRRILVSKRAAPGTEACRQHGATAATAAVHGRAGTEVTLAPCQWRCPPTPGHTPTRGDRRKDLDLLGSRGQRLRYEQSSVMHT